MINAIRSLTVFGALAALAASSLAVSLQFNYQGVRTTTSPFTVSAAPTPGLDFSTNPVSGISYTYTITGAAVAGTGEIDFKGGVLPLYFSFSGVAITNGGIQAGATIYSNSGLTTQVGNGAFSHSLTDTTNSQIQGQFIGTTAAPEPASIGAMALGVAGLLGRRKKGAR